MSSLSSLVPTSHEITLRRVKTPDEIDQKTAKFILVESFIGEYKKYLSPSEVDRDLSSWREGEQSVQKYYETYFEVELKEFSDGVLDYWVEAHIAGKLAGWATFKREKEEPNAVYMNLLVVNPAYQRRGIGEQLVKSLVSLGECPELNAIHLLLRRKNRGGRVFYSKLGFSQDSGYSRPDNFVNLDLLEGFTWRKSPFSSKEPATAEVATPFHRAATETYCGFKPGFLLGL